MIFPERMRRPVNVQYRVAQERSSFGSKVLNSAIMRYRHPSASISKLKKREDCEDGYALEVIRQDSKM